MGRIIRGQVIAGSGPDLEGEGLDRDTIRHLFAQVHAHEIGGVEHDLSQSPIARASNYQLVELDNGELQITADIEIFDEDQFSQMGGFSISFLSNPHQIGEADSPALQILLNPLHFNMDEVKKEISALVPKGYAVEILEKIEKGVSLPTAFVIIAAYTAGGISAGFLSSAGADLYNWFKGLVRKDSPESATGLQLCFRSPFDIILRVSPDLSPDEFAEVQFLDFESAIPESVNITDVARIIGSIEPGPSIVLNLVVLRSGKTVTISNTEENTVNINPDW